jgi:hypothetical protein
MFITIYNYIYPMIQMNEEDKQVKWELENPKFVSNQIKLKIYFISKVMYQLEHINVMKTEIKEQTQHRSVCKNYVLTSNCRYGKNCMYLHTIDPEIIKLTPCKYLANCNIRGCQFGHIAYPDDEQNDNCCNICLSDIYKTNKRFGLLIGCDHKFCVQCIKTHRSFPDTPRDSRMACPTCRQYSNNFFSSKVFLSGEKKIKEYIEYEKRCSKKKCRYGALNLCPHGDVCHFKHT